jgi:hypothetical protein
LAISKSTLKRPTLLAPLACIALPLALALGCSSSLFE